MDQGYLGFFRRPECVDSTTPGSKALIQSVQNCSTSLGRLLEGLSEDVRFHSLYHRLIFTDLRFQISETLPHLSY